MCNINLTICGPAVVYRPMDEKHLKYVILYASSKAWSQCPNISHQVTNIFKNMPIEVTWKTNSSKKGIVRYMKNKWHTVISELNINRLWSSTLYSGVHFRLHSLSCLQNSPQRLLWCHRLIIISGTLYLIK